MKKFDYNPCRLVDEILAFTGNRGYWRPGRREISDRMSKCGCSVVSDSDMAQIPRSTERISSCVKVTAQAWFNSFTLWHCWRGLRMTIQVCRKKLQFNPTTQKWLNRLSPNIVRVTTSRKPTSCKISLRSHLMIRIQWNRCKTQLETCKDHAYETAKITLLCHNVPCPFCIHCYHTLLPLSVFSKFTVSCEWWRGLCCGIGNTRWAADYIIY